MCTKTWVKPVFCFKKHVIMDTRTCKPILFQIVGNLCVSLPGNFHPDLPTKLSWAYQQLVNRC